MNWFRLTAVRLCLLLLLFSVVPPFVYGQVGPGRSGNRKGGGRESNQNYDPSQATIISGEVSALTEIESKKGSISGAGFEIAMSDGKAVVFLGPHIYVDFGNFRISPGDRIALKGVWSGSEHRRIFIAGEVRKGDEALKLRDEQGNPLWKSGGSKRSNTGFSW